jgi:hypothetical protein
VAGEMWVTIFDVEHGACAVLEHSNSPKLAMIDSGHNDSEGWYPSQYLTEQRGRSELDYLFITNADHDHMSDLNGLWEAGISVTTLCRSPGISAADLRRIKVRDAGGGCLSDDIERFLQVHEGYTGPNLYPFDQNMGGVTVKMFWNTYPTVRTTNDLSLATFFEFSGFKILFPGDLMRDGWLELLQREDFRDELDTTTVLVASHHGRDSGYCDEIFEQPEFGRIWHPQCVVFSDNSPQHGTQEGMAQKYGNRCTDRGIRTHGGHQRWVLTTRDDGWIQFRVGADNYEVHVKHDHG